MPPAKSVMSKSTSPKYHAVNGMQNAQAQSSRSRKAARQREAEQSSAELAQGVGERVQALGNASEAQSKPPFLTDCVLLGHAKSAAREPNKMRGLNS
jgi:hypothetical protein